jgi:hypothetical protein
VTRKPEPDPDPATSRPTIQSSSASVRPTAAQLLETPGGLLSRSHLAELGLGRAAIDAVFRALDVILFPGSSRPYVHREDYLALIASSTYGKNRVRNTGRSTAYNDVGASAEAPRRARGNGHRRD